MYPILWLYYTTRHHSYFFVFLTKSDNIDWTTTTFNVPDDAYNEEVSPKKGGLHYVKWGHLVTLTLKPIRIAPGFTDGVYEILPEGTLPKAYWTIEFMVASVSGHHQRLQVNTKGALNVTWSGNSPNDGLEFTGTITYISSE